MQPTVADSSLAKPRCMSNCRKQCCNFSNVFESLHSLGFSRKLIRLPRVAWFKICIEKSCRALAPCSSFSGLTIYYNYINYSIIKGGMKTLSFFLRQKIIVHRHPTRTLSLSNCLDFSLSIRTRLFSISLSFARYVLLSVSLVFS